MPRISVIMPVYNGEQYLREAIDSILAQTYTDFEFIILDDGSTDASADIVRSYDDSRIRLIQNEKNMGVAATLNRGLDLARGEYIARMDADDLSLPNRLERQLGFMESNPLVAVCGSNVQVFSEKGELYVTQLPLSDENIKSNVFISSPFVHPVVLMRKAIFNSKDIRYESEFNGREDFRLWTKLASEYKFANLPEILLWYRVHPKQVTRQHDKMAFANHCLLKQKLLEEQKIAGGAERARLLSCVSVGRCLSDKQQVWQLRDLFRDISEGMSFFDFPQLYHEVIVKQCVSLKFTCRDVLRLTDDLPMKTRIWYLVKCMRGRK